MARGAFAAAGDSHHHRSDLVPGSKAACLRHLAAGLGPKGLVRPGDIVGPGGGSALCSACDSFNADDFSRWGVTRQLELASGEPPTSALVAAGWSAAPALCARLRPTDQLRDRGKPVGSALARACVVGYKEALRGWASAGLLPRAQLLAVPSDEARWRECRCYLPRPFCGKGRTAFAVLCTGDKADVACARELARSAGLRRRDVVAVDHDGGRVTAEAWLQREHARHSGRGLDALLAALPA